MDTRLELDNARRHLHTLQNELRSTERQAAYPRTPGTGVIKEAMLPGLRKRVAIAEAEVARLEELSRPTSNLGGLQDAPRTHVEAATGPEYETNDKLDIPPFLRRTRDAIAE